MPGYDKYNAAVKAARGLTGRAKVEALLRAAKLRPQTDAQIPIKLADEFSDWRAELAIEEDWQKVNRKDKTDGMSQKAVDAYRRENPGSKLKTAVTEKNPTGKRKERRNNYCDRSDGQRKMHNINCSKTPKKKICKARKRWRC